jgi:mRNA interferase MazF
MNRGDIFYAELDPTIGSETNKTRPVLIISNNANNKAGNTVTILPITSNVTKVYPFEVFLPRTKSSLPMDSKIQCHQIRTISKLRINSKAVAKVDIEVLSEIKNAIKLHLAF